MFPPQQQQKKLKAKQEILKSYILLHEQRTENKLRQQTKETKVVDIARALMNRGKTKSHSLIIWHNKGLFDTRLGFGNLSS